MGQPRENWDQQARSIGTWLSEHDLIPQQTTRLEVRLVAAPLGSWTAADITAVGWRSEAIAVLLWALGLRYSIAPYDQIVDALEFERVLPILGDAGPFLASAGLRGPDEVDRERDLAELWHWRSRAARVQPAPDGMARTGSIVTLAAHSAYEEGFLPALVDDDFPAFGRAFRDLQGEQLRDVAAVAAERRLALNWLSGAVTEWDDDPPDGGSP